MAEGANDHRILRLRPGDVATVHAMLDLFAEAFEDSETYGADRPDAAYLDRLLADPTVFALVATAADGSVSGALIAYELKKFEMARSEVYIYDLAVRADRRRMGVATRLIEALRAMAADVGAWVVYVQADLVDEPAVQLYTKLGRREDVLHFDIPVG